MAKTNCDIIIKNRNFIEGNLKKTDSEKCQFGLKSGQKHKLRVCNRDNAVAEFESHDLVIEKIIPPKKSVLIRIRQIVENKIYKFEEEFSETHCSFIGI